MKLSFVIYSAVSEDADNKLGKLLRKGEEALAEYWCQTCDGKADIRDTERNSDEKDGGKVKNVDCNFVKLLLRKIPPVYSAIQGTLSAVTSQVE